ncbi:MAG: DUF6683 family protein [Erythrobacter sp.]
MISAQPTIIADLRGAIAPFGLDSHDMADAYAFWMINVWLVANKRDEDPDKGTIAMVRKQVRDALASTTDMAAASDADRQEYAEALLLQSAMLASAFEQWKGDPKLLDQLAVAARKGAKASDLDLSKMTLTRNGFVPRAGADASDAAFTDSDVQLSDASAASANDETGGLGTALAAGAGLGVILLGGVAMMRRG